MAAYTGFLQQWNHSACGYQSESDMHCFLEDLEQTHPTRIMTWPEESSVLHPIMCHVYALELGLIRSDMTQAH